MMKRLYTAAIALAAALGTTLLALPAYADEHGGERHAERRLHGSARMQEAGRWHGGRIEHFHERDFHVWRQGHWVHDVHDGRYGWWWFAAGLWYWYPAPIYPYPDPYVPPVALVEPAPLAPSAPPPPQYWYYCDSAGSYYPYVPVCPSGWRVMPAAPAR